MATHLSSTHLVGLGALEIKSPVVEGCGAPANKALKKDSHAYPSLTSDFPSTVGMFAFPIPIPVVIAKTSEGFVGRLAKLNFNGALSECKREISVAIKSKNPLAAIENAQATFLLSLREEVTPMSNGESVRLTILGMKLFDGLLKQQLQANLLIQAEATELSSERVHMMFRGIGTNHPNNNISFPAHDTFQEVADRILQLRPSVEEAPGHAITLLPAEIEEITKVKLVQKTSFTQEQLGSQELRRLAFAEKLGQTRDKRIEENLRFVSQLISTVDRAGVKLGVEDVSHMINCAVEGDWIWDRDDGLQIKPWELLVPLAQKIEQQLTILEGLGFSSEKSEHFETLNDLKGRLVEFRDQMKASLEFQSKIATLEKKPRTDERDAKIAVLSANLTAMPADLTTLENQMIEQIPAFYEAWDAVVAEAVGRLDSGGQPEYLDQVLANGPFFKFQFRRELTDLMKILFPDKKLCPELDSVNRVMTELGCATEVCIFAEADMEAFFVGSGEETSLDVVKFSEFLRHFNDNGIKFRPLLESPDQLNNMELLLELLKEHPALLDNFKGVIGGVLASGSDQCRRAGPLGAIDGIRRVHDIAKQLKTYVMIGAGREAARTGDQWNMSAGAHARGGQVTIQGSPAGYKQSLPSGIDIELPESGLEYEKAKSGDLGKLEILMNGMDYDPALTVHHETNGLGVDITSTEEDQTAFGKLIQYFKKAHKDINAGPRGNGKAAPPDGASANAILRAISESTLNMLLGLWKPGMTISSPLERPEDVLLKRMFLQSIWQPEGGMAAIEGLPLECQAYMIKLQQSLADSNIAILKTLPGSDNTVKEYLRDDFEPGQASGNVIDALDLEKLPPKFVEMAVRMQEVQAQLPIVFVPQSAQHEGAFADGVAGAKPAKLNPEEFTTLLLSLTQNVI